MLRYAVGLEASDRLDLTVADVNGDGSVNSSDAALILRYSVGLITKFPVEG